MPSDARNETFQRRQVNQKSHDHAASQLEHCMNYLRMAGEWADFAQQELRDGRMFAGMSAHDTCKMLLARAVRS